MNCPYCQSVAPPVVKRETSLVGWLVVLAGFCLTPFIIGVALIPLGFFVRENVLRCPSCGSKLK